MDGVVLKLRGKHILVVEDEYLIASDLADWRCECGAEVIGPVASVQAALDVLKRERIVDGALLDVNVADQRVFPVADALLSRGVPFVFSTGYDAAVIPRSYEQYPRCEKPVDKSALARLLQL